MKKFNWKQIENIAKGFYPNGITPIIAFASEFPVKLKENMGISIGEEWVNNKIYNFYASLIKKDQKYQVDIQAYTADKIGEIEILCEEKKFHISEKKSAQDYLKIPLEYFDMRGHIRVITFNNSPMNEEEFKEIIELWRTQPSQTKS